MPFSIFSKQALLASTLLNLHIFATTHSDIECGVGDDAAILMVGDCRLVWTVDSQVEDVHLRTAWLSWQDLGWRATKGAASDVGGTGAGPGGERTWGGSSADRAGGAFAEGLWGVEGSGRARGGK